MTNALGFDALKGILERRLDQLPHYPQTRVNTSDNQDIVSLLKPLHLTNRPCQRF